MFPNFNPNPVPAIPPGQSTLIPPAGRLTAPIGTYLPNTQVPQVGNLFNNPATAAAGFLGGTQPTNLPHFPNVNPGQLFPQIPGLQNTNQPSTGQVTPPAVTYDWKGNRFVFNQEQGKYTMEGNIYAPDESPTSIFNQGQTTTALSRRAEYLMNFDPEKEVGNVSDQTLRALLPGRSFDEIKTLMESKGYTYSPGSHGHPGVYILTGGAADSQTLRTTSGAVTGPMDARNRPEWVDPTTLAPGERVQVSSGASYVGGTPTASGQSQYAITVAQNINKKLEEKGAYKWVSKTVKDKEGNWVKVYSKQLRAAYTRHGQKNIDAKGEEQRAQGQGSAPVQPAYQPQDFNQLVTLRVSYG